VIKLVLGILAVSIVRVVITSVVGVVDNDLVILGETMVVTSGG